MRIKCLFFILVAYLPITSITSQIRHVSQPTVIVQSCNFSRPARRWHHTAVPRLPSLPNRGTSPFFVRYHVRYTAWWQRRVYEQLAQGRYLTAEQRGIESRTLLYPLLQQAVNVRYQWCSWAGMRGIYAAFHGGNAFPHYFTKIRVKIRLTVSSGCLLEHIIWYNNCVQNILLHACL